MNENEYWKDEKLYIRRIKKCECVKKDGDVYWLDCKIHQRGNHTYLCHDNASFLSKIAAKKGFYLDQEAHMAVAAEIIRFNKSIREFKEKDNVKIEIKELNTVVYYQHYESQMYGFLTEYHNGNEKTVTDGVKEGGIGRLIKSVPSGLDLIRSEERQKIWDVLDASDEKTIMKNPFYLKAVELDDVMMQKQMKLKYNIASEEDCLWLSEALGYRILPALGEEYDKNYVVKTDNIDVELLDHSGYRVFHRPYFAMQNSTHGLWQLNPHTKSGVDAARKDSEAIDFCDYLDLFNND